MCNRFYQENIIVFHQNIITIISQKFHMVFPPGASLIKLIYILPSPVPLYHWFLKFSNIRCSSLINELNILIFCCLKYNGYWVLVSQYFELEIDFWNVTIFKSGCHRNDVNLNQLLTAGVNFIGFCDHWSIGIGKHCNSVYWFWHINRYT